MRVSRNLVPKMSIVDLQPNTIASMLPASWIQASSQLLCIVPTSKTTTINDPTAGMTPDEITNYMSNVGGGMCGAPEYVRTLIGFGLNLSLIVFGLFTVSYVVLGGLNFALEKQIDDLIEEIDGTDRKAGVKSFGDLAKDAWNAPINTPPNPAENNEGDGLSRDARRLNRRLKKNDNSPSAGGRSK